MKFIQRITFTFLCCLVFTSVLAQTTQTNKLSQQFDWPLAELITNEEKLQLIGNPQVVETVVGKAVRFNGEGDGIILNEMPLQNFTAFTIELLIYPEKGGNFEQRFLHMGEIRSDRVLLELRAKNDSWYFDSYLSSGNNQLALIDSNLVHPLNEWYHVSFVVNNGQLSSYVNGIKELEDELQHGAVNSGKTSIGVRLNQVSWFKGCISRIRVSGKALKPEQFFEISCINLKSKPKK
ncbi:LamG domain-containing protein [uncultured Draconibacterium sp.]|uniref:LamG domain-containing protein n=1 Tax=uncultured Draconibacterium sp. TaxID=1573823 RepID=UPI0025E49A4C|nr:LamG domain-containing protein [uncultured Draconibacterium sp.]